MKGKPLTAFVKLSKEFLEGILSLLVLLLGTTRGALGE